MAETASSAQFDRLVDHISQWHQRRRAADALRWLPRGLAAGLTAASGLALLAWTTPLLTSREMALATAGLALLGLAIALMVVLFTRRTLLEQALYADQQFGLYARASTAVEIEAGRLQTRPDLAAAQLSDAVRAAGQVEPRSALPLRPAWRELAVAAALAVALALAILLPSPQEDVLAEQRAVEQAIAEQVAAVEALAAEIEANPELSADDREHLLEPIESALEQLQAGDLSREEAVAVLSQAAADLRELGDAADDGSLGEALAGAGAPLAANPDGSQLGQALQAGDLGRAAAAAGALADRLPALDAAARAAMAEDLAASANALAEVDPELAARLVQAAEALRQGDVAAAQQALREAAGALQQRAQEQAAGQQAAEAAGQLSQGQAAVAQAGQPSGAATGEGVSGGEGGESGSGNGGPGELDGQGSEGSPGGPGPGGGHVENVYVPEAVDLTGEEGVAVELPAECRANPAECGPLLGETPTELGPEESLVPYDQVFGDYRDAAFQALESGTIPLGLKDYIRDYFSSLEP